MLLVLQLNNLLAEEGEAPTWTVAAVIGGTAFSAAGIMGAIFLTDGTPVPASAVFLGGIAHAQDGRRYICLWPADDAVHYRGTIACRSDGAMVVIDTGTIADRPHGWAQTARGEVFISTGAPELIKDAIGQLSAGHVCTQVGVPL